MSHSQTAIPVPAPYSGVIEELFVPDGEKVEGGTELCKIKLAGKPLCVTVYVCVCNGSCWCFLYGDVSG